MPVPRCRLGTPWWEHDAYEASQTQKNQVGLGWYAVYLLVFAAGALVSLFAFPTPCNDTLASFDAVDSLPSMILFAYRVGAFSLIAYTLITRCFVEVEVRMETLARREIVAISHGLWRFQGLTQWQFALIGIYFGAAASIQYCLITEMPQVHAPSGLACAASTLLGVALSLALLTTVIVTFVLIPSKMKQGHSVDSFFQRGDLIMHNLNSLLLLVDLLASRTRIHLTDLPYTVLVGCIYVTFHHYIRFPRTRTLLYFFLSWQHPRAPFILITLLAAIGAFNALGVAVSEVLRPQPFGPPLVLLGCFAIMRLREPAVAKAKP
eukprot:CAMPEP_0174733574 /NCGR_PEP_ID=MMETSP1094-20130205/61597_1 /TAXON_ID=156173 /ORGANISM="Chrysochromulina brevifilum, Strain UTEX LB 985" /LENGTH=320 /DNA_ID=CAMNT_0015936261 /DNA_START=26 /DNA_END=988 /DNA_ORIENTATION=-